MKKRVVEGLLAVFCIGMLAAGCGAKAVESAAEAETVVSEEVDKDEPVEAGGTVLDVENLTKEQQNMLAVMDSLNMCMVENDYSFDAADPQFFWSALFYTIGNYHDLRDNEGDGMITCDYESGYMKVFYRLVQEYASGIFEEYEDLPEIPEGCPVTLDEDTEYYDFMMGDRGMSYGKIVSWTEYEDGTNLVETQLLDPSDETIIADYQYVLVENSYAEGITDPMFTYTVRSAEKVQ